MPWMIPAAMVGGSLLSGYIQGESNKDAAETSANAQLEAARIGAEEARFRPVGITSRFGGSQFQMDDKGRLANAGYELSPEMQQYQDYLMGMGGAGMNMMGEAYGATAPMGKAATGMFNLGQGYLGTSPQEQAQKYMNDQQALLAPTRERENSALTNQLYNTGRSGLSVGATNAGGLHAGNPEWEALYNSRAMQDLQLANNSTQGGMDYAKFGAGMFGLGSNTLNDMYGNITGASQPFQTTLGMAQGIEGLGQNTLTMGSELGGRASSAGAGVGQMLMQGGIDAARTQQQADAYNPWATAISNASNQAGRYNFGGGQQGSFENWMGQVQPGMVNGQPGNIGL